MSAAQGLLQFREEPDATPTHIAAKAREAMAELARLRDAQYQGHTSPCTFGALCPYCEIERLRAEPDEAAVERVRSAMDARVWPLGSYRFGTDDAKAVLAAAKGGAK